MNLTTAPSLNNSLYQLHTIIGVSAQLAGNKTVWGISIKNAIKTNVSTPVILATIKDAAIDNYGAVCKMIGKSLTDKILTQ